MTAEPKGLPHNWETERTVIGGILLAPETLADVREVLAADDFHRPAHQHLFALACELADRGVLPDMPLVVDEIERRGTAEQVGGIAYVVRLPDACASVDNLPVYSARVKEHAARRGLLLAARAIEEAIHDGVKDLPQMLDEAEAAIFGLSASAAPKDAVAVREIVAGRMDEIRRRAENPGSVTGIPTGFTDLDRKLAGLHRTDLVILAARPAMGKTAFVLNLACNAARHGDAVGMFSLEMSRDQLVERMLCSTARVDASNVRTGRLDRDDMPRLEVASTEITALPIYVDDTPGLTITQLRSKARKMKARAASEGRQLGAIIVDYIQLMQGSGAKNQNRENVISEISRGLKVLAKELDVNVIGLSQLNRSLEARADKRPMQSDLRESGALEQDADVILFIYRDEVYNKEASPKKGVAEIIIAKQRSGPIGTVELAFVDKYVLFQNLAGAQQEGMW